MLKSSIQSINDITVGHDILQDSKHHALVLNRTTLEIVLD
jgi:hypothetical protein